MSTLPILQAKIENYIRQHELTKFINHMSEFGDVIFFGGFVRDMNVGIEPKDIDITLDITMENWEKLNADNFGGWLTLSAFEMLAQDVEATTRNKFGGRKLLINKIEFDIWPMYDTWAMNNGLVETKAEFVHKTAPFSCNQITYNYTTKEFHHREDYFKLIKNKTVFCDKTVSIPDHHLEIRHRYLENKLFERDLRFCYNLSDNREKLDCVQFGDYPAAKGNSPYMAATKSIMFTHNKVRYFSR